MSDSKVAEQISLFQLQMKNKKFNDDSLRILQSVLSSKDVKLLFPISSSLKELVRSESVAVIRQIVAKPIDQQLSVLDFFVRAFAIIGDIENCLALRYEGLVLREHKSKIQQWLQVSYLEWLNFAEQSLENGFYAISAMACEYGLSSLQKNDAVVDIKRDEQLEKIHRLKNSALTLGASHSVQALTAKYLARKKMSKPQSPICKKIRSFGSTQYRNGIKKHNERKLNASQRVQLDQY